MKKGALVLSIILTGVVMALIFMLVSTYRKTNEIAAPETQATTVAVQEQVQSDLPAPSTQNLADTPVAGTVSIYDAAAEAAKVLGRNDVYIAEYAKLNDADVYLVTFQSGDLVYVSLDGQVISTSKTNPIDPYQPTSHR